MKICKIYEKTKTIKINNGAISSTINLWKMCLWWLGSIYKTLLIHFLVSRTIVVTAGSCHLESDACVPFFAIYVCCPQYIVSTPVSMLSLPIFHRWQRYLLYFWSPSFLTGQHFFGQKRAKNYTLCYHEKSPAKVLTTDETIRVELQQQIAQGICLKVILVLKRVCTYRFQTLSIFKVF